MLRSALITATLALGLASFAQAQVVNYGGTATTAPTANVTQNPSVVNAQGAPSVPAINTPVAHVGPQAGIANQPGEQATAPNQGTANATTPQTEVAQAQNPQAFDLGVSTVATNPFLTAGSGDNGKPLGDIAREMKQRDQALNAKTYTNADIDRLNQSTGAVNNAAVTANASNYPANNGVITPPTTNSIAAPVQNQSTTGNAPFSPHPTNNAVPATNENNTPTSIPQANAKPSANRPYEMASNNSANAGIPQSGNDQTASTANQANDNAQTNSQQLPKTASRLPLIGILGFFSISMGLFVRYQREKASK